MEFSDVDYRDIQGLVRFAHAHLPEARFRVLEIADPAAARDWIKSVADRVTHAHAGDRPRRALQIAFTCEALASLGVPLAMLAAFSLEFRKGMAERNRARRLGDVKDNAPAEWQWGAKESAACVLIMTYAETDKLGGWESELEGPHWKAAFHHPGRDLRATRSDDLEPFGFVDGVSQPVLDWDQHNPARLRTTTEYTNLSAVGEFVLGYPNEYGRYTDRPLVDADDARAAVLPLAEDQPGMRDFGRNGTFLVLRDLEQDIDGFKDFVAKNAPAGAPQGRRLKAKMSGRVPADIPLNPPWPSGAPPQDPNKGHFPQGRPPWRDPYAHDNPNELLPAGAPITPISDAPIDGVGPHLKDIWLDQFTFKKDADGAACPYGAHIRRANPRNADLPEGTSGFFQRALRILGFGSRHPHDDLISSTRFHRIMRRGRAHPKGLYFICLNANIARQFEFVQASWIANAKFNGVDEDDPLLGVRAPLFSGAAVDTFTQREDSGIPCRVRGLPQFVTMRGGAYFFLPGIRALRDIAGG